jgi:hypothetical protein
MTPTPTPTEAAALDALRAIRTQAELTARAFPNAPGRGDLLAIAQLAQDVIDKNTVTASRLTYTKGKCEKTELGTFTTPADTLESVESATLAAFPNANSFLVTEIGKEAPWAAGYLH